MSALLSTKIFLGHTDEIYITVEPENKRQRKVRRKKELEKDKDTKLTQTRRCCE